MACYIWYSEEGTGRGPSPPRPLIAVPNVTEDPSTASVPIAVLMFVALRNISHIWGKAPRKDIAMKFGTGVDILEVVTWAEFDL